MADEKTSSAANPQATDAAPRTPLGVRPVSPVRSPLFRQIYVEGFRHALNATIYKITLLSMVDTPGGASHMIQDEATLIMSPQILKVLAETLSEIVRTYETKVGPIKVVKEMRPTPALMGALFRGIDKTSLAE